MEVPWARHRRHRHSVGRWRHGYTGNTETLGDMETGDRGHGETRRHGDSGHGGTRRHGMETGDTEALGDRGHGETETPGDMETRTLEKEETQPVVTTRAGAHWPVVCLTCLANQEEMIRQSPGPPCECRAPHF